MPLRLRLTLLVSALVGVTLLVFSLVVYFTLEAALTAEVDRALVDRAQVVLSQVEVGVTPFSINVELPDTAVDAIATGGTFVQVVDLAHGQVAAKSASLGREQLPVSREALAAVQRRQARFERVRVAGVGLRLYDAPLVVGGRAVGMLQVARLTEPTDAALARLRLLLAIGALASVAVCGLISLAVARAALRPIDRLTREAERIGQSQDFGQRVREPAAARNDEVGRLAATFNSMLDRLQEAYGALQDANRRLEAALASQRRFVADASHELRTPLTTVRGNASLLRRFEALTPEDREAAIEQIVSESERMSRLVSDLLTLARADAGQLLERKPVPLAPLLEAVAQQGRVLAEGKVSIGVVQASGAAEAAVLGDADALRQLLLILVDNAIKYTPPGGNVTLGLRLENAPAGASRSFDDGRARAIRLSQASPPATVGEAGPAGPAVQTNEVVKISVADTGIGIAPEDLPHIFDRFYRADRARRAGGTGLGLAIGRWIAEAHGGTITVESAPGAGSIFTVTLPAIKAATPADPVCAALPPATAPPG